MRLSVVLLVVVMAMATASGAALADGASPPAPNCDNVVNTLLPCFGFVTGSTEAPSKECCSGLASVAASEPTCLCSVTSSGNTGGINATRALELPGLCGVTGVNPSSCPGTSPPSTSPPVQPAPDANSPPLPPTEPSPPSPKSPGPPYPSPSFPPAGGPGPQTLPESAAQFSMCVSRWYIVWGIATLAATAVLQGL